MERHRLAGHFTERRPQPRRRRADPESSADDGFAGSKPWKGGDPVGTDDGEPLRRPDDVAATVGYDGNCRRGAVGHAMQPEAFEVGGKRRRGRLLTVDSPRLGECGKAEPQPGLLLEPFGGAGVFVVCGAGRSHCPLLRRQTRAVNALAPRQGVPRRPQPGSNRATRSRRRSFPVVPDSRPRGKPGRRPLYAVRNNLSSALRRFPKGAGSRRD